MATLELTRETLEEMAATDVRTVNINALTDLRDIQIDTKKSVNSKIAAFAGQTNNLYIHRIGDYIVKVKYQPKGPTIDEKMEEYLRHLAEIHI